MGVSTTWVGGTSSDWATAGNWTNGLPGTTGTAVIDGSVSITGGTPSGNAEVERVYVASTYTGAIGSSGTPLELDVAEMSVDNNSSGSAHYIHLTGSNNTTPTVMVDGLKVGNALYLSGDLDLVVVEDTFLGFMYLGNSASKVAAIKDLVIKTTSGTIDASTPANVAWVASATVDMTSGTLNLGENIGDGGKLYMSGGTINVSEWTKVGTTDEFILQGGTVNWNAGSTGLTPSSVNAFWIMKIIGGTFTTAANEKAYVGLGAITQFGGTLNLQSSFANIDINTAYNSYAGTFIYPKQSVITTTAK